MKKSKYIFAIAALLMMNQFANAVDYTSDSEPANGKGNATVESSKSSSKSSYKEKECDMRDLTCNSQIYKNAQPDAQNYLIGAGNLTPILVKAIQRKSMQPENKNKSGELLIQEIADASGI